MTDSSSELKKEMLSLLNQKLPEAEAASLTDEGFKFKNPKRKTAVAVALYKKAVSGDLSAIRELRSIVSGEKTGKEGMAVRIIEDI